MMFFMPDLVREVSFASLLLLSLLVAPLEIVKPTLC